MFSVIAKNDTIKQGFPLKMLAIKQGCSTFLSHLVVKTKREDSQLTVPV